MAEMGLIHGKSVEARVWEARQSLGQCDFCEIQCGGNRFEPGSCACATPADSRCFKRHVSFAEEVELLPSYMTYFSGCNFRCRFCVQAPECFESSGEPVAPERYARLFERALACGAKTINLVGGEPTLHLHTILAIAAAANRPLPLVVNSNMYMSSKAIRLLNGVYSLCLADFKYGNDKCAEALAGISSYVAIVTRNLKAVGQERLLVRHLLLPGHLDCCFVPVANWMAKNLPLAPFHVLTTYVPGRCVGPNSDLSRLITKAEIEQAGGYLRKLGLRNHAIGTTEN